MAANSPNAPTYFAHGANWLSSTSILRQGLKYAGRGDIHMVLLRLNPRQEAYVWPGGRKIHLLIVDGAFAPAAGVTFRKLGNDAIAPKGLDGAIPPRCITSIWPNDRSGRVCRDMESARIAPPPVEFETATMIEHGPPVRVRGFTPPDQPSSNDVPVASQAPSVTPRARRTQPRDYAPRKSRKFHR